MLLPIAPHGAPGLESETPEGKPAPEQRRLFAGQPRIKASALQQAFEDGHVVDVEEGEVVAVGPGARDETGKLVPLDVKDLDVVRLALGRVDQVLQAGAKVS